MRAAALTIFALCATASADVADEVDRYVCEYRLYVDGSMAWSSTDPGNHTWRTKQTSYRLDEAALNLAMAVLRKEPDTASRWGFTIGAQAGRDSRIAVPDASTGGDPIAGADFWSHVYRASVSWLFPVGRGLKVEAGLLPGALGYESFLSGENPTYTRGYVTDYVPYFVFGVSATLAVSESLDVQAYAITGWDYLSDVNDVPGVGLRVQGRPNASVTWTQHLYYGPEQDDTDASFWRFFSQSVVEYRTGRWTVAAVFDFGTERLADVAGEPRAWVIASSVWLRWDFHDAWWLALRAEIYDDADGMMTGARQTLYDTSVALRYRAEPWKRHAVLVSLEYRYDRSTGPDGGFFSGPANALVGEQHVLLVALTWSFSGGIARRE